MAITSPPDSRPAGPAIRRGPRRGPRTRPAVALLAGLAILVILAGPTSAAKQPLRGTASVSLTGDTNCNMPITYTWSNFGGPNDAVEAHVALYLHQPGVATDILLAFSQQSESPAGAVARGGSMTWQDSPQNIRQFIQSVNPHGAATVVAYGSLIRQGKKGGVVAGSEAASAPMTLPMSCRIPCDYIGVNYEGCVILGNIVLRQSQTDFSTTPPTITYISNVTYTLGGRLTVYPTCIGITGCPDPTVPSISGSGTFSSSTGLSGTWTARYEAPLFFNWSGGVYAGSCQLADVRQITAVLDFSYGAGSTGQGYLSIRTDQVQTGPTFDYVSLQTSSMPPGGTFHTGDLTQLMINC